MAGDVEEVERFFAVEYPAVVRSLTVALGDRTVAEDAPCATAARSLRGANALTCTCSATAAGRTSQGVVVIDQYPGGTRQLLVTFGDAYQAEAAQIIASLR